MRGARGARQRKGQMRWVCKPHATNSSKRNIPNGETRHQRLNEELNVDGNQAKILMRPCQESGNVALALKPKKHERQEYMFVHKYLSGESYLDSIANTRLSMVSAQPRFRPHCSPTTRDDWKSLRIESTCWLAKYRPAKQPNIRKMHTIGTMTKAVNTRLCMM